MSEALWQGEDVLRAVHGSCLHEQAWLATGVSIDSRTVQKGDLYIALQGTAHDGHDHVADAFAAGAVAAIVTLQPSSVPSDAPLIFVSDTLAALHELARAARARSQARIVAVTGAVGKTSCKNMLRLTLGAVGKAYATKAESLHHLWDLPLALAALPADADYGIFEIAVGQQGELAELSKLARPDIVIVTPMEEGLHNLFDSNEETTDAKCEIFQGMNEGGLVILKKDSPHFARMVASAKTEGLKKIQSFACEGKADAWLIDCALTSEGSAINASLCGYKIHYSVGSTGMHLVHHSLPVLLAAYAASGKREECANALSQYKAAKTPMPSLKPDIIDDHKIAS